MNRLTDTDLREALRRKYADTPLLPADFMERMRQAGERKNMRKRRHAWLYVLTSCAAAAGILLLLTFSYNSNDKGTDEKQTAMIQKTELPGSMVKVEEKKQKPTAAQEPVLMAKTIEPTVSATSQKKNVLQPQNDEVIVVHETAVHEAKAIYAAYQQTDDTDSLPPSRVDEFITKLADYHHITAETLGDSRLDTVMSSIAYVFPDNDKVRLFDRLLQVASSYSYDSPGYQLNISQQQLLFSLEDRRQGLRYLWLAERISAGRIILYASHAPKDSIVSSAAYQDFREKTTHTNQTTEL